MSRCSERIPCSFPQREYRCPGWVTEAVRLVIFSVLYLARRDLFYILGPSSMHLKFFVSSRQRERIVRYASPTLVERRIPFALLED